MPKSNFCGRVSTCLFPRSSYYSTSQHSCQDGAPPREGKPHPPETRQDPYTQGSSTRALQVWKPCGAPLETMQHGKRPWHLCPKKSTQLKTKRDRTNPCREVGATKGPILTRKQISRSMADRRKYCILKIQEFRSSSVRQTMLILVRPATL